MAIVNPRIHITMPIEIAGILNVKAKKNKTSLSKAALDLITDSIERDEDIYFSKIAEERESTNKQWISHKDAWK
jgi:hypothetical protein